MTPSGGAARSVSGAACASVRMCRVRSGLGVANDSADLLGGLRSRRTAAHNSRVGVRLRFNPWSFRLLLDGTS